jgi:hypothetical protein
MPVPPAGTPAAVVQPAAAPASPGFTDSFATAVDSDPGYGLNYSLNARQSGVRGITYTRVGAASQSAGAPRPWYSQVNHVNHPGTLSFWLGTSAIRMDAPVVAGPGGTVSVRATVDPVTGNTTSGDYSTLVLSTSATADGYVANPTVAVGVGVSSDGTVRVYHGATVVAYHAFFAAPAADGRFVVSLTYTPGQKTVHLAVNGVTTSVASPAALPASPTLFAGAYQSRSTDVSTLGSLQVSGVNKSGLSVPASSGLRYYGYYAARLGGGPSHLAEVAGRSNLNWVNVSDASGYPNAGPVLSGCAPGSCVVNTGFEFFTCPTARACHLYPNYAARWQAEAAAVQPYLTKIAAFYILDEPQWNGATPAEIDTSAKLIKQTFPGIKVMMIEAGPKVTSSLKIPSSVDWAGFDWYCQPFTTIKAKLATMLSLVPASSPQRFFLMPDDAPVPACAGIAGHTTDGNIAAIQRASLTLAEQNPRVIGLLNFGFWTSAAWTAKGSTGASELPQTVDADERAAAQILAAG